MSAIPRLTIGLPVYNGEKYLTSALDSILQQTFDDFELIISDNASTDATERICSQYSAHDPRVHYFRFDQNYGASRNFNRVVELAPPSEYFKWVAHDDIYQPNFVELCIATLDQDPSVVLAYSKTAEINADCEIIRLPEVKWAFDVPEAHRRFLAYMRLPIKRCFEVFGVIRLDVLRSTHLLGNFAGADLVLLSELALRGKFYEVPERLFLRRHHPGFYDKDRPPRFQRTAWFDTAKQGRIVFPAWTSFFNYMRAVSSAPLQPQARLLCYREMLFYIRRRWKPLLQDLIIAVPQSRKSKHHPIKLTS
jgi:glycosyltransferase involved in cell wall biosynthesis